MQAMTALTLTNGREVVVQGDAEAVANHVWGAGDTARREVIKADGERMIVPAAWVAIIEGVATEQQQERRAVGIVAAAQRAGIAI